MSSRKPAAALAQNERIALKNRLRDSAAHNLEQLREGGGPALLSRGQVAGLRQRAAAELAARRAALEKRAADADAAETAAAAAAAEAEAAARRPKTAPQELMRRRQAAKAKASTDRLYADAFADHSGGVSEAQAAVEGRAAWEHRYRAFPFFQHAHDVQRLQGWVDGQLEQNDREHKATDPRQNKTAAAAARAKAAAAAAAAAAAQDAAGAEQQHHHHRHHQQQQQQQQQLDEGGEELDEGPHPPGAAARAKAARRAKAEKATADALAADTTSVRARRLRHRTTGVTGDPRVPRPPHPLDEGQPYPDDVQLAQVFQAQAARLGALLGETTRQLSVHDEELARAAHKAAANHGALLEKIMAKVKRQAAVERRVRGRLDAMSDESVDRIAAVRTKTREVFERSDDLGTMLRGAELAVHQRRVGIERGCERRDELRRTLCVFIGGEDVDVSAMLLSSRDGSIDGGSAGGGGGAGGGSALNDGMDGVIAAHELAPTLPTGASQARGGLLQALSLGAKSAELLELEAAFDRRVNATRLAGGSGGADGLGGVNFDIGHTIQHNEDVMRAVADRIESRLGGVDEQTRMKTRLLDRLQRCFDGLARGWAQEKEHIHAHNHMCSVGVTAHVAKTSDVGDDGTEHDVDEDLPGAPPPPKCPPLVLEPEAALALAKKKNFHVPRPLREQMHGPFGAPRHPMAEVPLARMCLSVLVEKAASDNVHDSLHQPRLPLAGFFFEYLMSQFGLRSLAEQHALMALATLRDSVARAEAQQNAAALAMAKATAKAAKRKAQREAAEAAQLSILEDQGPALDKATRVLQSFSQEDYRELAALPSPPPNSLRLVFEAACRLLGVPPSPAVDPGDSSRRIDDWWAPARRLLALGKDARQLVGRLASFDRAGKAPPRSVEHTVTLKYASAMDLSEEESSSDADDDDDDGEPGSQLAASIKTVTALTEHPQFDADVVGRSSPAAASVCAWVRSLVEYNRVARVCRAEVKRCAAEEAARAGKAAELKATSGDCGAATAAPRKGSSAERKLEAAAAPVPKRLLVFAGFLGIVPEETPMQETEPPPDKDLRALSFLLEFLQVLRAAGMLPGFAAVTTSAAVMNTASAGGVKLGAAAGGEKKDDISGGQARLGGMDSHIDEHGYQIALPRGDTLKLLKSLFRPLLRPGSLRGLLKRVARLPGPPPKRKDLMKDSHKSAKGAAAPLSLTEREDEAEQDAARKNMVLLDDVTDEVLTAWTNLNVQWRKQLLALFRRHATRFKMRGGIGVREEDLASGGGGGAKKRGAEAAAAKAAADRAAHDADPLGENGVADDGDSDGGGEGGGEEGAAVAPSAPEAGGAVRLLEIGGFRDLIRALQPESTQRDADALFAEACEKSQAQRLKALHAKWRKVPVVQEGATGVDAAAAERLQKNSGIGAPPAPDLPFRNVFYVDQVRGHLQLTCLLACLLARCSLFAARC
jgi:hypothetical protein